MVIWIIGLSGSGKTYLSKKILKKISNKKKFIHLDGDEFRKYISKDLGYSLKDREINAERISKLVKFLSDKNINLIVSVLSNFPHWLSWNKKNIKNYYEIFIQVDKKELFKRNKKNLYLSRKKNVVGKDIKFYPPKKPNIIFKNNFNNKKLNFFLKELSKKLKIYD